MKEKINLEYINILIEFSYPTFDCEQQRLSGVMYSIIKENKARP